MSWYKNPWFWLFVVLSLICLIVSVNRSVSKSDCKVLPICVGFNPNNPNKDQGKLCQKDLVNCEKGARKFNPTRSPADGGPWTKATCDASAQECSVDFCKEARRCISRKLTWTIVSGIFAAVFLLAAIAALSAALRMRRMFSGKTGV